MNAWIEIDLEVFDRNLGLLKDSLSKKTQLCAILKSNAYGAGIGNILPSIIAAGVACVGVASNEEARLVRAYGFSGRLIRVRTGTPAEVECALSHEIEELVGSLDSAQAFNDIAIRNGGRISVHIGLNSGGMSRNDIDLNTERGRSEALSVTRLPGLRIAGLTTHFAVNERQYVLECSRKFTRDTDWIISNSHLDRESLILHAANSFAAVRVPESHFDMVRTGGAMYGYQQHRNGFEQSIFLKSRVASVNFYPAGNTVGYDRNFSLSRDSLLANLPIGYGDGYRRAYSNKASVLIRGQRAAVVGKISMNTTMVDVTDIDGVAADDEVVLYGKQGSDEITRAEMEAIAGVNIGDQYMAWSNSNPKVVRR
jgi:alanine racemase